MAANEVQRLDLKDLDAVLERAKAEEWAELGLVAGWAAEDNAARLIGRGWPVGYIFSLSAPLPRVPAALLALPCLTSLSLGACKIGDNGAETLAELEGLETLHGRERRCGRDGSLSGAAFRPSGAARLAIGLHGAIRSGARALRSRESAAFDTLDVLHIC